MEPQPDAHTLDHALRDISARAATAVGLIGIGLIHALDAVGKYEETPYIFWMYVALILGTIVTAAVVLFTRTRLAFLAAAALAASALVGYVLSRTTGLPSATGDIGNWIEPLGLASMFVEATVIGVAGAAYALSASLQHEPLAVWRPGPQGA
jgi:xanthine/uracil permease